MCVSFLLVAFEDTYGGIVPFSSLIAVMCIGISLQKVRKEATERLSQRYNKLWVVAEILLFVLVGASVNIDYALKAGVAAIILIFLVLLFRMFGVFIFYGIKLRCNSFNRCGFVNNNHRTVGSIVD